MSSHESEPKRKRWGRNIMWGGIGAIMAASAGMGGIFLSNLAAMGFFATAGGAYFRWGDQLKGSKRNNSSVQVGASSGGGHG